MNVPEKHRAIAHAWVDGAEIEIQRVVYDGWMECHNPAWDINSTYRIKHKPKVKKWRWVAGTRGTKHIFITPEYYSSEAEVLATSEVWVPIEKIDATEKEFDE